MRHAIVLRRRASAAAALALFLMTAVGASAPSSPRTGTADQVIGQAPGPEALGFKKSFVVEIRNPAPIALQDQVIVIDVPAVREAVAWDFNTYFGAQDCESFKGSYAFSGLAVRSGKIAGR